MTEWLVVWGAAQSIGFLVKPILEDLAKEASRHWARDLLKGCFQRVLSLPVEEEKKLAGKAIKAFLEVVENEIESSETNLENKSKYISSINRFVKNKSVLSLLGKALGTDPDCLLSKELSNIWVESNEEQLPCDFDWYIVSAMYLRKVRDLKRDIVSIANQMKAENNDRIAASLETIAGFTPGFDLEKLSLSILQKYRYLRLEPLDIHGEGYQVSLWHMFMPLKVRENNEHAPQNYLLPKEIQRHLKIESLFEKDIKNWEIEAIQKAYKDLKQEDFLRILQETDHLHSVILGDPGSGKSTLLKYLALSWAERPTRDLLNWPIPLLIELKRYVHDFNKGLCKNFLEFLERGDVGCQLANKEVSRFLLYGNALVMFDGLDEIFDPSMRQRVVESITRFANDFHKAKIILTSRIVGYRQESLKNAGFRHFVLQDLDLDQVNRFIEKWHAHTEKESEERNRKQKRLFNAIKNSAPIRQLAGNPLLLTMMSILNRSQELPRDRVDLYKQASRLLLHQWDVERALTNEALNPAIRIDLRDKQVLLRKAAFQMQHNEEGLTGNIIRQENLEAIFEAFFKSRQPQEATVLARTLIDNLQTRNFILCDMGGSYFGFIHKTFLEFFCAWEISKKFNKRDSSNGMSLDQLSELFLNHFDNPPWKEILCLVSGMVEPEFMVIIIQELMGIDGEECGFENLFFAGACVEEVREKSCLKKVLKILLYSLKELINYDYNFYYDFDDIFLIKELNDLRKRAISIIASIGFEFSEVYSWLKELAENFKDEYVRYIGLKEFVKNRVDDDETISWLKKRILSDEFSMVRGEALKELITNWNRNPEVWDWLMTNCPMNEEVCIALLKNLNLANRGNSETISWIIDLVENDISGEVKSAALEQLSRHWKHHPNTIQILKKAVQHGDADIFLTAVHELGDGWGEDIEVQEFLKTQLKLQASGWRQMLICNTFNRYWEQDSEITFLIKKDLIDDDHEWVRSWALGKVATNESKGPELLSFLKTRIEDTNSKVRCKAVELIAELGRSDPEYIAFLRFLSENGDQSDIRKESISQLVKIHKESSDFLDVLKKWITQCSFADVREEALIALSRNWKQDSETLPILKKLAIEDESNNVRCRALQRIVWGWKTDPEIFPMVKDIIWKDPDGKVRSAALENMAHFWKEEPGVFELLMVRLEKDDSGEVRRTALRELARGWNSDSRMPSLLKKIVKQDSKGLVREAALKELLINWSADPEVILLANAGLEDGYGGVREVALEHLSRTWKNDPKAMHHLKSFAEKDENDNVRYVAVEALARDWNENSETLPLLISRAKLDSNEFVREKAFDALFKNWRDDPSVHDFVKKIDEGESK